MNRRFEDFIAGDEAPSGQDDDLLAANVARLRRSQRLSQAALAEAMRAQGMTHWHQTTASRVELGRQRLTGGEVLALQKILGNEVIAGTELAGVTALAYPAVRSRLAQQALAQAEDALTQALNTVRELRAMFNDEQKDNGHGDD